MFLSDRQFHQVTGVNKLLSQDGAKSREREARGELLKGARGATESMEGGGAFNPRLAVLPLFLNELAQSWLGQINCRAFHDLYHNQLSLLCLSLWQFDFPEALHAPHNYVSPRHSY